MTKKFGIIIIVLISFQYFLGAQEPNLDKILKNYYKVNGLEKFQNVKSVVMTGSITRNDLMPIKITKLRPDKFRMDFELADLAAVQAYDGKTGWSTAPWTGNPKPTLMDEDALKDVKNRADFEGLLFNFKEKGHLAEFLGKDTIGNTEVYKIKLNRKDGGIEFYFIDSKNFQLVKRSFKRLIRGKEIDMENIFSDYRPIEDILFPFVSETTMGGQRYSLIEFEKIEINAAVDEKIFSMP
jgi:hypothetical protein